MKIQDSEILRRSSVFRFVSDEHFEAIEPLLQEEHYEFGEVIVKQGDPANSFYVLTSGRARALKIKPDGEEIPLGVLKPGDSFGEAALAEGGTRNATVRCSTAVDVLRIDRDDFLQLVRRVPDLKQYIESTGRNRALQSFLYQFSNFGRLPASRVARDDRQANPRHIRKRQSDHSRRGQRRAALCNREGTGARIRWLERTRAQSRVLSRRRFLW